MFSSETVNLATQVLHMARSRGYHLATAESCTGGLIMAALTEIAGSSDVVDRGFITYTNQAKTDLLKVDNAIIETCGAVSGQCAIAMAMGALGASAATLALSVTGIAGPDGGTDEKPVGLVHIAIARQNGPALHQKHLFGDIGRREVRQATVIAALKLFLSAMT